MNDDLKAQELKQESFKEELKQYLFAQRDKTARYHTNIRYGSKSARYITFTLDDLKEFLDIIIKYNNN